MKFTSRNAAGIVLFMAAGFGLAWLLLKRHSEPAAKELARAPVETAATSKPPEATPPRRQRAKHPRRGSQAIEASEAKSGNSH